MQTKEVNLNFYIKIFIFLIAALTSLGLVFIYSASSVFAQEFYGSSNYFLKKQLIYLFIAILASLVCALFPLNKLKTITPTLFFISLIVSVLTFFPNIGMQVNGASRWIRFFGFSFQPSEFLKLFLFLYLGFFLERKHIKINSLWHSYFPFLLILTISGIILFKQPDFGTAITIFITAFLVLFVADFSMTYIVLTFLCSIPMLIFAICFKAYRLNRILIFFNPWADPKGKGYQIIQSLIAIGSGGFLGLGIGHSKQKFFYLPMQHTDFIFSIIAEESGFLGSSIILLLYFLVFYIGVKIATRLKDSFSFFTTLGFVILICLQASINLMVVSGLAPTKGLGLPFISYGGTSLIAHFCMIGFIANFVRNQILKS